MKPDLDAYLQYRVEKSDELFEDAVILADKGRWSSCINRLYYSSFHLVHALLYQRSIITRTHDGLKNKFFLEFIKTGIIPAEYGKLYSQLLDWRQESDYSAFVEFDEANTKPLIKRVKELNEIIKNCI